LRYEFESIQTKSMRNPIILHRFLLFSGALLIASSCQRDENLVAIDAGVISALPQFAISTNHNAFTEEKKELGRKLFWDPILSGTKNVSCASCHHPELGYADGRSLSSGVDGLGLGASRRNGVLVKRNSPTILNVAFNGIDVARNYDPNTASMFWDNRAAGLEEQALLPILSKEEMRGAIISEADIMDSVLQRLNALPAYRALFADAFGAGVISENRLAQAISIFQRSLITVNSPFDQYMRGDETALNNQEIRGMNTFLNAGCSNCHNGPMFSDYQLHTLSVPNNSLVEDDGANGRFDFRTPTLRNLNITGPYMHNGNFNSLRDVLDFYNDISGNNSNSQNSNVADNEIDDDARNLRLNRNDVNEILTFLATLNDYSFDKSVPSSVPSGLEVGGSIN
jgi:cytochrome c peroxidase